MARRERKPRDVLRRRQALNTFSFCFLCVLFASAAGRVAPTVAGRRAGFLGRRPTREGRHTLGPRVPAGPAGPVRRARVPVVRQGEHADGLREARVVPAQQRPAADRGGARDGPAAVGRRGRAGVPRAHRPVVGPRVLQHGRRAQLPGGTAAGGRLVRVAERARREQDRALRAGRRAVVRMTAAPASGHTHTTRGRRLFICLYFFFIFFFSDVHRSSLIP